MSRNYYDYYNSTNLPSIKRDYLPKHSNKFGKNYNIKLKN